MYKSKSADRPSTPKLSSIALPLSPELRPHAITQPSKPSKSSSWFGFLRPSSRHVPKPSHNLSWSSPHNISRPGSSGTDDDDQPDDQRLSSSDDSDDDESESESEEDVVYKPQRPLAHPRPVQARPSITLIRQKTQKELDMEELERRDAQAQAQSLAELKRRAPHAKVTETKSKAAKEIEMEREEREREELQRYYERSARQEPRPLKSCLKNSPQKTSPKEATPSPPLVHPGVQHLKRRESSAGGYYYSDTEQLHHQQKPMPRRQTYPIAPPPILPNGLPTGFTRARGQSLSDRTPYPAINPANYVKAHCRQVPMKPEAISLSWPLIDFQTRRHVKNPPLFFDAAFNPRLDGYEVKILSPGDNRVTPIPRDMAVQLVSPHAFMTEMILYNETLRQWPVFIRRVEGGIRCIDVFRAIYDTYSVRLTDDELRRLSPSEIERSQPAFSQRCRDGPYFQKVEEAKGLCRVDLLRSKKFFKGLTPYDGRWGGPTGPNVWELHFERISDRQAW